MTGSIRTPDPELGDWVWQNPPDLFRAHPEPWSVDRIESDDAIATTVDPRMDMFLQDAGRGIELHGIGLDSHDGRDVGRELTMADLRQHRIG